MKRCIVIGIAGGSGSGKSTLAALLLKKLSAYSVRQLAMDSYYKAETDLPLVKTANGRQYRDYNCPDSFDLSRLKADIDAVKDSACDVLIMEGLLTLWDEDIRRRCDMRVFVDCPADIRVIRRIKRNLAWGLTLDEITDVYIDLVRERHETYVAPSAAYADLIVDSANGVESGADQLCKRLENSI